MSSTSDHARKCRSYVAEIKKEMAESLRQQNNEALNLERRMWYKGRASMCKRMLTIMRAQQEYIDRLELKSQNL